MKKILVYSVIVAFLTVMVGGCATYGGGGRNYRYYRVRSRTGKIKIHEKHETEIGSNLAGVQKLAIYTAGGALVGIGLLYLLTRRKPKPEPRPEPKPEEGKRILVCREKKFLLKEGKAFEVRNGKISEEGKKYEIVDNRYLLLEGREIFDCN